MSTSSQEFDVLVLGAGAAGLFCAAQAGQRGLSVAVLDHMDKPAEKVRISGGGRCNFTNVHTAPDRFLSENPHFVRSALARYKAKDFIDLVDRYQISWHEKALGQLFCDGKSQQIIDMLMAELRLGNGKLRLGTAIKDVAPQGDGFRIETSKGRYQARSVVVATGGLSIPKIGASPFAYDLAEQFGHEIIATRPALVPLTFSDENKERFAKLAGVSTPVRATAGGRTFDEAMLFTHRGLSGPAILQISSFWQEGEDISLDLLSAHGGHEALISLKHAAGAKQLGVALERLLPKRLIEDLGNNGALKRTAKLAEVSNASLLDLANRLGAWTLTPNGTEGWRTAEVTAGGIDTTGLSSKTMESHHQAGLYFVGEAVDVTGWLGGYNFQWAWASAHAAAEAVAIRTHS